MLKHVLLTGAVLMATPAIAQTAPTSPSAPATAPTPATPMPAVPAADPAPIASTPPAAPADPSAQIAEIVNREFPSYDTTKDGILNKVEFGAWMFALRKAANPALQDDAANKTYVAGSFATADTDKSKSVSKDELIKYLVDGQKEAQRAAATKTANPAT